MSGLAGRMLNRAWTRLRYDSKRYRHRVRSLPIRAAYAAKGLPVPPGRLIHLVAGTEDVAWFLGSGEVAARCLKDTLTRNGVSIESLRDVLDFGCGVGRVIRYWDTSGGSRLHGVDYNPELVAWCQASLPFATFQVNVIDRPLEAHDESFDFAYALSVFTHLSEPLQRFWMDEMLRVLRPGGHLFVSTHGAYYLDRLSAGEQTSFHAGRSVIHDGRKDGSNDVAVFHPESHVRQSLASGYEVVEFVSEGALGNPRQDAYLLRKPA
jgi:SAM-dependent methyltransferase